MVSNIATAVVISKILSSNLRWTSPWSTFIGVINDNKGFAIRLKGNLVIRG